MKFQAKEILEELKHCPETNVRILRVIVRGLSYLLSIRAKAEDDALEFVRRKESGNINEDGS